MRKAKFPPVTRYSAGMFDQAELRDLIPSASGRRQRITERELARYQKRCAWFERQRARRDVEGITPLLED